MGPWGIDVDDRGIYTTGFWIEPMPFRPISPSTADLVWINQNGDGFVDRFFGEEAESRGQDPNQDQIVNTHVKVGRWHIGLLSGFNQPYWASVVGPDGHGLFNVNLPNMPSGLGTDLIWIDDNTATPTDFISPLRPPSWSIGP